MTVATGAVLDLNGTTDSNSQALTLNGTGINGNGALINSSTTGAKYNNVITIASATSIFATNGNITLAAHVNGVSLTIGGTQTVDFTADQNGNQGTGPQQITVSSGTLSTAGSPAAGFVTNNAAGSFILVLSGASFDMGGITPYSAYSEPFTLNGGTLINSGGACTLNNLLTLGSAGGSIVANNGALTLNNAGTITGAGYGLTLGGTGRQRPRQHHRYGHGYGHQNRQRDLEALWGQHLHGHHDGQRWNASGGRSHHCFRLQFSRDGPQRCDVGPDRRFRNHRLLIRRREFRRYRHSQYWGRDLDHGRA